jgi:hypothetical protein
MPESWFCPLTVTLIHWYCKKRTNIEHHNESYDESDHLQVHEQVIRPLFNASTEVYIYRGTAKERRYPWGDVIPGSEPIKLEDESILKPQKGKYIFDKTQECITGHEYLWNATVCKRGSIVFVLESNFDFSEIFKHCYEPGELRNPNTGQSSGAIRLCKKTREENAIAAVLSASNGIEYILIYAQGEVFEKISNLAYSLCKSHDEWLKEYYSQ